MTDNIRNSFARALRDLPTDLLAIIVLTMTLVATVLIPVLNATPLRTVLALAFMLFIPGYALVAALFPEKPGDESSEPTPEEESLVPGNGGSISHMERVALSFGTSVASVMIIGLVLNITPFGLRLSSVLTAVAGTTLGLTYIATYRRLRVPEANRLVLPFGAWAQSTVNTFTTYDSRADALFSVVAVVALLIAVTTAGYAFAVPPQGDPFTEFYIVTEGDDEELVADDYPTDLTVGEPESLVVGIGNHEHRNVRYSLVVELQEVAIEGDSTTVLERDELHRQQIIVGDGDSAHEEVSITPERDGDQLRLAFMLFKNEPPAEPTIDNAYRQNHLWVNVSAPA